MNNILNQNEKVLEVTLTGSNSDVIKTPLRGLPNFKMALFLKQILEKPLGQLIRPADSICYRRVHVAYSSN